MEFFYDQIFKIKNNIILILIILFIIFLNDFAFWFILKGNNEVKNVNNNNSIALNDFEEKVSDLNITTFKIDIKGEVKKPGVYEVNSNMNVYDAITLAGGLTKKASTDSINLSKNVKDQMVIIVPNKSSNKKSESTSENRCASSNNPDISINPVKNDALIENSDVISNIDADSNDTNLENNSTTLISINNATVDELMNIPGIGESKAKKIIEYRNTNCFKSIEDIKNVSGIGESLFEKIKDYITV